MSIVRSIPGRGSTIRGREPTRIGVNLAAMIDVVFLLLIYFMVATDFRTGEDVFRLDLPDRQAHADLYQQAEEPLVILLRERPSDPLGYDVTIEGPWPSVVDADDVGRFLAKHRVGGAGSGTEGFFTRQHPIIILATPRVAWSHVVGTFNAVVGAGYDAVSLEVQ